MSIVINDDERLEESESFTVTLEAMDALDGLVRLEQTLAIITISDDDGELRNHKLTHTIAPLFYHLSSFQNGTLIFQLLLWVWSMFSIQSLKRME